jgi:hypothetical protein
MGQPYHVWYVCKWCEDCGGAERAMVSLLADASLPNHKCMLRCNDTRRLTSRTLTVSVFG